MNLNTIISLLIAILVTTSAKAIVIRHDVSDKDYLKLGQQYSSSVAYIGGCAATVIDSNWIVTAAHCLNGKENRLYFVKHLDKKYRIEKTFIHLGFDSANDEINDIALVQVKDKIENADPALLYQKTSEIGLEVIFVGRGTFGNGRDGLIRDDYKQRGATNIVDSSDEHVIEFTFTSPPEATKYEGISSRGDSGGPAFIKLNNQLYVIGVSSYQQGRGIKEGHYGVGEYYTRISKMYPWINQTIEKAPFPIVILNATVAAIKENNLGAMQRSLSADVLKDKNIVREAFYQAIMLDKPLFIEKLIQKVNKFTSLSINDKSLFEFSLQQGKTSIFKLLLQKTLDKSNVHDKSSAVLPLFISAFSDSPYLLTGAKALITQGANTNARTMSGETALITAGWNTNNSTLVELLTSNGANPNIANNNGDTPLMDAAHLGKNENLRLLVNMGADKTLTNKQGKTAWDLAKQSGNQAAIDLLTSNKP